MSHYVKNKDLKIQIQLSKDASVCTPELLDMFFLMSNGLARRFTYRCPEDKQDAIICGVEDAWKYFWSYDENKSPNAFAYVSQVIKNGMAKSIKTFYEPYYKADKYIQVSPDNIYSL
jgi:hypothetical protein